MSKPLSFKLKHVHLIRSAGAAHIGSTASLSVEDIKKMEAPTRTDAIEKGWAISAKFSVTINHNRDRLRIACDSLELRNPETRRKLSIPTSEINTVNYDRLSNTICLKHANPKGNEILSYWGIHNIPAPVAAVIKGTNQLVLAGNRMEMASEIWEPTTNCTVEEKAPKTKPSTYDPFEL